MALASMFFGVLAWGEGGLSFAWLYLLLLLVSLVQCGYPTFLGWILLLIPSSLFAVAIAITPDVGPWTERLFFFLCGAVPAASLYFWRPTAALSKGPEARTP
jgi:hypothetical protein